MPETYAPLQPFDLPPIVQARLKTIIAYVQILEERFLTQREGIPAETCAEIADDLGNLRSMLERCRR